jgi:hypothetical protein
MSKTIREAKPIDIPEILQVMEAAKKIMRSSGNMHQWGDGYPSEAVICSDMEKHGGFVIEDAGRLVGYFAFLPSPEPTYSKIYEGEWIDDSLPYHVIHRIASYPEIHGVFKDIMDFCFSREVNIRIDTHKDNLIMQHNIEKHGFAYCGIIHLASGDERLAYQAFLDSSHGTSHDGHSERNRRVLWQSPFAPVQARTQVGKQCPQKSSLLSLSIDLWGKCTKKNAKL